MAERQRWALTGPVGAGKSTAASYLASRGAAVVDGDALGHVLLAEPALASAIRAAFGEGVWRAGAIDRAALGALVFGQPALLRRLDELALPLLSARMRVALDAAGAGAARLAVLEAAVYFLMPPPGPIHLTVSIVASPETRLRRLLAAGRGSEADLRRRIEAQTQLEALWARADVVLENEGTAATLAVALDRLLAERRLVTDGAEGRLA